MKVERQASLNGNIFGDCVYELTNFSVEEGNIYAISPTGFQQTLFAQYSTHERAVEVHQEMKKLYENVRTSELELLSGGITNSHGYWAGVAVSSFQFPEE